MKIFFLSSSLLLFSVFVNAEQEKPVDAKVKEVTIFLNKAQVFRTVKTQVASGTTHLVINQLSSSIDPQSIQVAGKGSFILLGVKHRQNYLEEYALPKEIIDLKADLEEQQTLLQLTKDEEDILQKEEAMILSNQKIGGEEQVLEAEELEAMANFFRRRLKDIHLQILETRKKYRTFYEKVEKLKKQLNERQAFYNKNTSEIVISISAKQSTSVELAIDYTVANAGWYPIYDLRAKDSSSPIQLLYKANVYQNTGENWEKVRLTLSTANPTLGGIKPYLNPWYLNIYTPYQTRYKKEFRSAVGKSAPEPIMEEVIVASDEEDEAETISNYTQTVQTSLNVAFKIDLPYTIPSGNKEVMVDISAHELPAAYRYGAVPKIDKDAFLIAKVSGWEKYNLLPGNANIYFSGTFVGESYIQTSQTNDTLDLSLGRDKRIIISRKQLKDFTTKKFLKTDIKEDRVYTISVRNTKNEPITITLEDQIPITQHSDIKVKLLDADGATYDESNGKLVWELTLPPSQKRDLKFSFEVRYPKNKTISNF